MQEKPNLDFDLNLKYVLYKKTEISGFQIHTTIEGGQQAVDICNFANEIMDTGRLAKHFNLDNSPIFGVYTNMTDESDFDYTIGCKKESCVKLSATLVSHTIPTS